MNKEFTASDRGLLRHPSPRRSRRRRKATPGPDASAIHGQLGAQVALLQSPILPAAVLNYHKYKNFHCYPVDKPHTRIIAAKEPCGRLRPHPHETSRAIRTSHSVFTRRGRGPSAHGQNFPRTATGPSVAAPSPPPPPHEGSQARSTPHSGATRCGRGPSARPQKPDDSARLIQPVDNHLAQYHHQFMKRQSPTEHFNHRPSSSGQTYCWVFVR